MSYHLTCGGTRVLNDPLAPYLAELTIRAYIIPWRCHVERGVHDEVCLGSVRLVVAPDRQQRHNRSPGATLLP